MQTDATVVSLRLNADQITRIEELIHRNISALKQQAESVFEKGNIPDSVRLANEADHLAEIRRRLVGARFEPIH